MTTELRIGILGAASIAPSALIKPAQQHPRVAVTAVAARSRPRAEAFARKHDVPVVHPTYEALLADPQIDAVYVPLPNGLHADWMLRAIDAGKHVLCEKPFTANRAEAERVAEAADAARARTGLVVMEAFHYRHHALAARMQEIVRSGELGELRRVEAEVCFPLPRFSDIRYDYGLAGGATMDAGCYSVHVARLLGGETPAVTGARMLTLRKDSRRPCHGGRSRLPRWSDRASARVDVVAAGAVDPGARDRFGGRAGGDQLPDAAALSPVDDPRPPRRRPAHTPARTGGPATVQLRLPVVLVRSSGPRRRSGAHLGQGRRRDHGHHRRHLPRRRSTATRRARPFIEPPCRFAARADAIRASQPPAACRLPP
ncbi:Gfo/Idh/MocA family oxidoreductase [Streptomyces sp. NPDC126522]|uniref:Gfo/Idh/MocA family protein n=1 Tax=Streptomyces sp. NPDC126522 TaxID=3155211 RepID=UPI0033175EF6